jgi:hypothetical protein
VGAHRLISAKPKLVTPELYGLGNAEGRPAKLKASTASYLAGFLDGDGSVYFQLVRQSEYRFGFYIRSSVSFSQATSARFGLERIQQIVGGGYLRDRGTGMSDLVVTSRPLLMRLLSAMEPFVIFKREQVQKALWLLPQIQPRMSPEEFLRVAHQVDAFASLNHSKSKRISAVDVEQHLRDKGLLGPRNDSFAFALRRDGDHHRRLDESMVAITRRPLERG